MPLAGEFGKFIAETRYDDIPIGVRHAAKIRILDLLGAALAGYHAGRHKALLPLLDSAGDVTAWGLGGGLSLRDAILFNSFLSPPLLKDYAISIRTLKRFRLSSQSSPCFFLFSSLVPNSSDDFLVPSC